jgi:membrane-associated phospholipid phosphatase
VIVRLLMISLIFGLYGSTACASDNVFNSTAELQNEMQAIKDESVQVVTAPFKREENALLKTLAVAGAVGITYAFDTTIRDKVQGMKSKGLDDATKIGSNAIGNPFVHLGVAFAVYGGGILGESERWKDTGLMLGEAAVLADAGTFVLKSAVGRARPYTGNGKGDFKPLQFSADHDSFPSMHTSSAFAMASVMSSTSESIPAKLFYYSAATFVGFSRLYQDKHWSSDILLGAAIGELCGRVVTAYHQKHTTIALVPTVTQGTVGLALLKSW